MKDPDRNRMQRPELLRFDRDSFMDDVMTLLQTDEDGLKDVVARTESWRAPDAGWQEVNGNGGFDPDDVIKLFQPAHMRFYLAAGNLVCRRRGLPDKRLITEEGESASFIVRRLILKEGASAIIPSQPATFSEYAWTGESWVAVDDSDKPVAAEQKLPLFPIAFTEKRSKRKRRMLAGFIPVAQREVYESANRAGTPEPIPDDPSDPLGDVRRGEFSSAVVGALRDLANGLKTNSTSVFPTADARNVLAFALLDMGLFFKKYASLVFDAIQRGSWSGPSGAQKDIYDALDQAVYTSSLTWPELIADVLAHEEALLSGDREDESQDTPSLDLDGLTRTQIQRGIIGPVLSGQEALVDADGTGATTFTDAVDAHLAATDPPSRDDLVGAPPNPDASAPGVYHIRFVYDRPNCGVVSRPVVSRPSQAFELASFFDSDAPVRPARIALPVDTSISGLRKQPKNVSILLSKELRSQMDRVKGVSALEDGELGDGKWDIGMICSLSIPIITICALIVLMIIVQLLNIVFWWLPFFKICLPIPIKK